MLTRQSANLVALLGFGEIRVFSPQRPESLPGHAEWVQDPGCRLPITNRSAFIGLSDSEARVNALRIDRDRAFVNLIHPTAVNETATLDGNVFIDAFGFVGLEARLSPGVVLNSRTTVEHDNVIGEGVTLGTGATLCGRVEVGAHAFVGAGAVVRPQIRVAAHTMIGAGAVLVSDVPEAGVYVGSPARRLER